MMWNDQVVPLMQLSLVGMLIAYALVALVYWFWL